MKTILFLCTGNYYRSRFAEYVFNDRVRRRGIPYRAVSRGLAIERGADNHGPMCPVALKRLGELGIDVGTHLRDPLQAVDTDFAGADRIIALDKAEHTPLVHERFPAWERQVEYWAIPDRDPDEHRDPLAEIVREVDGLVVIVDR
jgi:protein-tyrosine phosphatase